MQGGYWKARHAEFVGDGFYYLGAPVCNLHEDADLATLGSVIVKKSHTRGTWKIILLSSVQATEFTEKT